MSTFTIQLTNPEHNYTGGVSGTQAYVPIKYFRTSHTFDTISEIVLFIDVDVFSLYDLDSDSANPVQVNSTINIKRAAFDWFLGYVTEKPTFRSDSEGTFMQVTCWGREGILTRTIPHLNGDRIWKLETTSKQITDLQLLISSTYGSFGGDTLWPDPSDFMGSKCYIHDTLSNSDTLGVNIGTGIYAISAVNQFTQTFSTLDNIAAEMTVGTRFKVQGSTGNDEPATPDLRYSVVSAIWTGVQTDIVVTEVIPNPVADGGIINDNIILSNINRGFKPRGWIKIVDPVMGDEWINFDGYDDADADGVYRLRRVHRGELGTTAVAHNLGRAAIEKIPKQIAPGYVSIMHNTTPDPPIDYRELRVGKEIGINVFIGSFVLPGIADGTDYKGTYRVYDEDRIIGHYVINGVGVGIGGYFQVPGDVEDNFHVGQTIEITNSTGNNGLYTVASTLLVAGPNTRVNVVENVPNGVPDGFLVDSFVISINEIVETICTASYERGGPGIDPADLVLAAGAIRVNRYEYDPDKKPKYAWDAIVTLLKAYSLEDELKFWFNHHTGQYQLGLIQTTIVHFSVPFVERIEKDYGIEDLYSAVEIEHTDDQNLNQNDGIRCWHPAAAGFATIDQPTHWYRVFDSPSWLYKPKPYTTSDAAGNFGMDVTADGRNDSKLMAFFHAHVTKEFVFGHWYFGDDLRMIDLEEIEVAFGCYRACNPKWQLYCSEEGEVIIRFEGCDDYNKITHTGTWQPLGFRIKGKPPPGGDGKFAIASATQFSITKVNAIRIIFEYMPGPKEIGQYWAIIHSLRIIGNTTKYVYVQLTDQSYHKGNPLYVTADAAMRKLRGGVGSAGTPGSPRVLTKSIGAASGGAAISIGRDTLKTHLRKHSMRRYEYTGALPVKPELGLSIGVDEDADGIDDYIGTIREYAVTVAADGIFCRAAVYDPDTSTVS